ncbi:serine/threonine-protein kinase [Mangrovihabitans endophyticus]|uniref:non-specific serine/threonine protein kinase n=1 Tax=Mangrovihabitans endophyticus TaxID=1751298 RepID=A0A8J3C2R5_9ACTN|nr:serine/threonine-protein kinase [Mangrovihabitans endophyticus]GGL10034.1 hypothetical protein GCM10012284_50990 [Mangrovihabitans endophyticus]
MAGRYRLLAPVGSGGMGRVWRARDELLGRDVALKELRPPDAATPQARNAAQAEIEREARAAARLDHPGVVRIFDVVRASGRSWLVMEYVPADSLAGVIRRTGPLPHREAARIGLAVLDALSAAHDAGVLHRDVKPENVLVVDGGRVVLADFGLATVGPVVAAADGREEPLRGSPHYVAPERVRDGLSNAATDLWSLGATLYAAVEGRPPFARPSVAESLAALLAGESDPVTHPGPLHPVIARLLEAAPARRYSVAQARAELRSVAGRAIGVVTMPAPGRGPDAGPDRGPDRGVVAAEAANRGAIAAVPAGVSWRRPGRPRRLALTVAGAGAAVAVAAGAAAIGWGQPGAGRSAGPSPVASIVSAGSPCSGAAFRAVAEASADPDVPADTVPAGWVWRHDPAGFDVALPSGWRRAAVGDTVCFRDADGARSFTVAAAHPDSGEPLQYWQQAEKRQTGDGELPGYRRISMDVQLVPGGGADWEYLWEPRGGRRLHTYRALLPAGRRTYQLSWTTADFDWSRSADMRSRVLSGFRDSAAPRSTWAVPSPPGSK